MGDFLKSAMNYFTPVSTGGAENDFVGTIVEVQSLKLRIKRVIAEGELNKHCSGTKKFPNDQYTKIV